MQDNIQQIEVLSPDVVALCGLLARILKRCIVEQDAGIMALLASSTKVQSKENEVSYEQAA